MLELSKPRSGTLPIDLPVDCTGLPLCGPGEWLDGKHGGRTRRLWRKLPIGVDAGTGRIVASTLTTNDVDDTSQVGRLLEQVAVPIASFTADGAYDQDDVYGEVARRHADAAAIVPRRSSAVTSATADRTPTRRDQHLRTIAERGRMGWQMASGYNWRALAEADISRFKRVIGGALRARTDRRRAPEMAIAVSGLNRMPELGRPEYVRVTWSRMLKRLTALTSWSVQRTQYEFQTYRELLAADGPTGSMSRRGNPYDRAKTEAS